MMPHLGVLSSIQPAAAQEVFEKDCLVPLGTCLAITNTGRWGEKCLEIKLNYTDGRKTEDSIPFGELRLYPLGPKEEAELEAHPARSFDLGKGKGHALKSRVTGGVVGLVVDTRGRPLNIPKNNRIELLKKWANALGAYPNS